MTKRIINNVKKIILSALFNLLLLNTALATCMLNTGNIDLNFGTVKVYHIYSRTKKLGLALTSKFFTFSITCTNQNIVPFSLEIFSKADKDIRSFLQSLIPGAAYELTVTGPDGIPIKVKLSENTDHKLIKVYDEKTITQALKDKNSFTDTYRARLDLVAKNVPSSHIADHYERNFEVAKISIAQNNKIEETRILTNMHVIMTNLVSCWPEIPKVVTLPNTTSSTFNQVSTPLTLTIICLRANPNNRGHYPASYSITFSDITNSPDNIVRPDYTSTTQNIGFQIFPINNNRAVQFNTPITFSTQGSSISGEYLTQKTNWRIKYTKLDSSKPVKSGIVSGKIHVTVQFN